MQDNVFGSEQDAVESTGHMEGSETSQPLKKVNKPTSSFPVNLRLVAIEMSSYNIFTKVKVISKLCAVHLIQGSNAIPSRPTV